ncbi:stimulus-sensing domain-containing protein [Sphingomonas sp. GlSt437]|uniref:sensor histidine kinase n=1 Tax=Sphingomonas sp. GlSt437 TaxID=3389970 RepID=UPI003A8499C7
MAQAIVSPRSEPPPEREDGDLSLRWSGRVSLTRRILAVNIFALAMLAGGFFYLDSYRSRILDYRLERARREVRLIATAVGTVAPAERPALIARLAHDTGARIRLYDSADRPIADSRMMGVQNFVLVDPTKQPWTQRVARFLDAMIDTVVGAQRAPLYRERAPGRPWPDVGLARADSEGAASAWRAPDRTPVITAAAVVGPDMVAMTTSTARDITTTVRAERFRLSLVLALVTLLSVLLSLFLARTIVRPLRRLARAAVRVRRGRARDVVVPTLPTRGDEIGMLARAVSDMTLALRARIDATEAFAADVTHELKNPLASLRSAVEGLGTVRQKPLRDKLTAIIRDDVHRLDRLITDISEASRLDAQLSRARFDPVDIAAMVTALLATRRERGIERGIDIRLDKQIVRPAMVMGDGGRLERVFENLIDNAISFSPDNGLITIALGADQGQLVTRIEDEGPGVPEEARDAIFRRFQSIRPESEEFGKHSGLGLAIARTIVEAHQGMIAVESREDRLSGARFVVRLPLAGDRQAREG